MKRNRLFIILAVSVFIFGVIAYSNEKSRDIDRLPRVNKKLLSFFEDSVEFSEIITYEEEDINNDTKSDLIIVYKDGSKYNKMVAVINDKTIYITEPVIAPKEDVVLSFKDVDSKDNIEVMLSGSKNGSVGYAIFRLEKGKLIDLFGEGMEDCC